jgi:hypothetical protein
MLREPIARPSNWPTNVVAVHAPNPWIFNSASPPIPCPTKGGLVISVMLSSRHFSKTYYRRVPDPL